MSRAPRSFFGGWLNFNALLPVVSTCGIPSRQGLQRSWPGLALQVIGGIDDDPDVRIDFCLYRDIGSSALQTSSILFDDLVTYDIGGSDATTTRSDHLGVHCEFAP